MSVARTSRIVIDEETCEIHVHHRLAFINDHCDTDRFNRVVEQIKEAIARTWSEPEFRFEEACTVHFHFDYVEAPGDIDDETDVKVLRCGRNGVSHQRQVGPEKSLGVWYIDDPEWAPQTAAHEVGHELGMTDKYECLDAQGNLVDCTVLGQDGILQRNPAIHRTRPRPPEYPRNGIAFTICGVPQQDDIDQIMEAFGVKCPCFDMEIPEDPLIPDPDDPEGETGTAESDGDDADTEPKEPGTPENGEGESEAHDGRDCSVEITLYPSGVSGENNGFVRVEYQIEIDAHLVEGHVELEVDDQGRLEGLPMRNAHHGRDGFVGGAVGFNLGGQVYAPGKCGQDVSGTIRLQFHLHNANERRRGSVTVPPLGLPPFQFTVSCPGGTTIDQGRRAQEAHIPPLAVVLFSLGIDTRCTRTRTAARPSSKEARRNPFVDQRPRSRTRTTPTLPPDAPDAPDGPDKRPLIFVPGFMGSTLTGPDPDQPGVLKQVWPPELTAPDLRPLDPDVLDPNQLHPSGIYPDVYQALFDFLEQTLGYVPDHNFWPFPYKWTVSNRESGARLASYILEKLAIANARRRAEGKADWSGVDIINHSNGGLVTRVAMILNQRSAQVHKTVYLASPHYGAPQAYFVAHPDIPWHLDLGRIQGFLTRAAWWALQQGDHSSDLDTALKELAVKLPTVYELMPDRFYLRQRHVVFRSGPEDEILGAKQTYAEGGWRLYDPNSTAAQDVKIAQLTQAALQLKDSLGETLPGDYLNVYAENLDTNDIVEFTRTQPEAFNAPQSSPRKGDETVPEHSASLGGRGGRLVEGNHTEIPEMTCVHNRIADYIRGD